MHRIGRIASNISLGRERGGKSEHRHDRVAHIFINEAIVCLDMAPERLHVIIDPFHDFSWL